MSATNHIVNSIIASYGRQRVIPQLPGSSSSTQANIRSNTDASISTKHSYQYKAGDTPPPALQQQTPPTSPYVSEPSIKETPPPQLAPTPETHETKKRLTYDSLSDQQKFGSKQNKKAKADEEVAATEAYRIS